MSTTAEDRKALRYGYSKQGEDVSVVALIDDVESLIAQVKRLEFAAQNARDYVADLEAESRVVRTERDDAVRLLREKQA